MEKRWLTLVPKTLPFAWSHLTEAICNNSRLDCQLNPLSGHPMEHGLPMMQPLTRLCSLIATAKIAIHYFPGHLKTAFLIISKLGLRTENGWHLPRIGIIKPVPGMIFTFVTPMEQG